MDPIPRKLKKMSNHNYTDEFGQVLHLPEMSKVLFYENENSKSVFEKSFLQMNFSSENTG